LTNERARAPAIGNAIFAATDARPRPGQCAAGACAKGVIGGSYFRSSSTTTGSGLGQYPVVPHPLEVLMSQQFLLMPPLAALLYPFLLEAFHANIAPVISGQSTEPALQSAAAALFLLLAFAAPIVALLGAMTLGELAAPSLTQRRARTIALLAVAAPPLFVFLGVEFSMLHDPVPDTGCGSRSGSE
jgi:hypothetical protein